MTIDAAIARTISAAVAPLADEIAELRRVVGCTESRPTLLRRNELARELSISTRTLDTLRSRGLPEVRVADSPRFELSAVLDWLRTQGDVALGDAARESS